MQWMYLLPLLLTVASSTKKLSLQDIEKDNLRSETRGEQSTISEQLHADESKYSVKAEVAQQYYAPTAATATPTVAAVAPQEHGNQVGDYAELQSYGSFKYASGNQQQDYVQENDDASALYLQDGRLADELQQQQNTPQQQYYTQEGRSHSQTDYDSHQQQQQQQQQLYQQEVLVGNQLQSVQQKAAALKYIDGNENKGIYYINIPMSQLLAYYQNYGIVQSRSKNAEQQVSIPIYQTALTQNQVYAPTKLAYQPKVQYVPTYPKYTEAVIAKSPPSTIPHTVPAAPVAAPLNQAPIVRSQQYSAPADTHMSQKYAPAYQPQRYQYQYVTEQNQQPQQYTHQQHKQQQIVLENAPNAHQNDAYNQPSTPYEQDNFLYEQQQQQQHQYQQHSKQQQYYIQQAVDEQLMSQLLHQASLQNSIENIDTHSHNKQEPIEQLHTEFIPPQYQAQKFRPSQEITHLDPISNEYEGIPSKSVYSSASYSSQPKTLLDSYVPSHVIAAQDSHRYRERPIKLESGFLPSKMNFIGYNKHKSE